MDMITPELIAEITADIRSVANEASLCDIKKFSSRAHAIDFIAFHILGRLDGMPPNPELDILKQWALRVMHQLESIDTRLFEQLRKGIRDGLYAGASFNAMIRGYTGFAINNIGANQPGYDTLDNFINGLLTDQHPPEATQTREAEMVFYQQTPARIIFELAARAMLKPNDVFVDIGSGLGHVPILLNLISGATTKGIEYESAYYTYAQACATRLNLSQVEFINADARKADYTHANVFFMYTPFKGAMLDDVLNILRLTAQERSIRIFTYGPCSKEVAKQSWLTCADDGVNDEYRLYEFKRIG